jgi:hypothetical protein
MFHDHLMDDWAAVERHYLQQVGKPTRTATFRRDGGASVDIYKWDANATSEGVALYATVGASQYAMPGVPADHRVEFFVGLSPERDDIVGSLAALALYAVKEQVAIGHGHTVPAGKPLWPGTEMSSFLVMRPLSEIVAPMRLPNGTHIDFLQAIPVYASEVAFKAQHKTEDLLALWQKSKVPFWNPERVAEPATP